MNPQPESTQSSVATTRPARPHRPIVCLKDLSFAYEEMPIIEGVNLDIEEGAFAVVVGPNGGGKTTLVRLIAGMLRPTAGSVLVFGRSPSHVRARIGYTPQHLHFDTRFPVTVFDVILMGRVERRFGGPYTAKDREIARRVLDEVSLAEYASVPFASLSGGQRRRSLLARALASEPDLLLLDEPMAGVDAAAEKRLFELLKRLNRRMTIVMVSHNLSFVTGFVDSVICVNRSVALHPTAAVTTEAIRRLYGTDVRIIQHDYHYPEERHLHD